MMSSTKPKLPKPSNELSLDSLVDEGIIYRVVMTFIVGVVIAGFLTWFMHALIESSQKELDESIRATLLDFVRVNREEVSQRKKIKPQRPEMDEAPPAPPTPQADPQSTAEVSLAVPMPQVASNINVDLNMGMNIGVAMGDGEYLPIVKMSPTYPPKALSNQIEGSCLVTYTVTVTGSTKNINTVKGQCPAIFARSAKMAAKKFKYRPRVIDGEAVEVPGVFNRFDFSLFKEEDVD